MPRASETPTVLAPQRVARSPRLEETDSGRELIPIRSVVPDEGRALVRSLTKRLESLEERMTRSESVVDKLCHVQHQQLAAFRDVTRDLGKITKTLAGLDVGALRRDVVGAVRDMMREESVTQVCAQRPGPPAREPPSTVQGSENRREGPAPPGRAGAGALVPVTNQGTGV